MALSSLPARAGTGPAVQRRRVWAARPSRVKVRAYVPGEVALQSLQSGSGLDLPVTRLTDGQQVPVRDLMQGRAVVAFLRHLGCPFCWDYANSLAVQRQAIQNSGFKLVFVSIGATKGGEEFCTSLNLPRDILYLDTSDRNVYKALSFEQASYTDMSDYQRFIEVARQKVDGWRLVKDILPRYKPITPGNLDVITQMGGLFVVNGDRVLLAWQDSTVGDHPPLEDVLRVCQEAAATQQDTLQTA